MKSSDTLRSVDDDGVFPGEERDRSMWDSESSKILEDIANECLLEAVVDACLRKVAFHFRRRR